MKSCLLLFLIVTQTVLNSSRLFAQQEEFNLYSFPKVIGDEYCFDASKLYGEVAKISVDDVKQRDVERYAEMVSYGKKSLFESGLVYLDWKELEDYLNQVLHQILPKDIKKEDVHVYPSRLEQSNAFAIYDGSFYINVGLLADVINEAGLAITLGHELAHYVNEDVKNYFFNNLKIYTKRHRNKLELRIDKAYMSREQEHTADSIGFVYADRGGYDLKYGISDFHQFLIEEQIMEDKSRDKKRIVNVDSEEDGKLPIDLLLSTHPETKDRIDYLKENLSFFSKNSIKEDFIVSKSEFEILQQKAQVEVLALLLKRNQYSLCAEKAFFYYLFEPGNNAFVYYLMEASRRMIYLDPSMKSKGFLTENYGTFFNDNEGILNNLAFLVRDSIRYKQIKTVELLDTNNIPFNTYEEAYNYFSDIAMNRAIVPCYLTNALMHHLNDSLKKYYLQKYLLSESAENKIYANTYLEGKLTKELSANAKELILFDEISFWEDHYYGLHKRLILAEENGPALIKNARLMMKKYFPEKYFLEVSSIVNSDFQQFNDYKEFVLATTSFNYKRTEAEEKKSDTDVEVYYFDGYEEEKEGKKGKEKESENYELDIFILNPFCWNFFYENRLKSVEYIHSTGFDDKTTIIRTIANTVFMPLIYASAILFSLPLENKKSSLRYAYNVTYYSFDMSEQNLYISSDFVHYKMNKVHLSNSIYHLLRNQKKEKEKEKKKKE